MMVKIKILSVLVNSKKTLLVGLIVCMAIFLASFSSAITWDNLAYYSFEETTGVVVDEMGTYNGINDGADRGATGKVYNAFNYVAGNSDVVTANTSLSDEDFSFSVWVNASSLPGAAPHAIRFYNSIDAQTASILAVVNTNIWTWRIYGDGGGDSSTTVLNAVTDIGSWQHFIGTYNQSDNNMTLYKNGVQVDSETYAGGTFTLDRLVIGGNNATTNNWNGTIDELGIWDRVLTSGEITDLYNSGSGIAHPSIARLSINLTSPENGYVSSDETINFTATFNITGTNSNNYTWKNTTLYVWDNDGVIFDTNYTALSGNDTNATMSIGEFTIGDYKWNYIAWYGNDTYTNYTYATNNYTFEWRPFEINSQDYNEYVYETDNQRFNLSITTLPNILSVTSKLNYNGSEYTGTTSCLVGVCDIYSIIDIPLISTGENVNYSYYWTITVYDGTSSYSFDTTEETKEQNVTRIHLEKCAGIYTTETINFTAYREDNLTQINPFKIQGTFDSWLGSGDVKRSTSFNEVSVESLKLCLTPTTKSQFTDALIEYSFNDENITYVPRNYHFQNATLTNISNEIKLYLLEAEDSTSFIIKVQDQKLSGVSDALVYIQRYYPQDGEFRTVQISKTDSNGETIGFYEVETVDYKHIIIKDGEVLLETSPQKVVGKSVPYTLTFTVGEALGFPWSVFEKDTNIQSTLKYNKTSMIVTFTYIDTTGGTTSGNLIVYSFSNSNSTGTTICDVSSIQSSATLTCNMTGYDGTFVAYGYIESEPSDILNFIIATGREIFGKEGLLIGIFIIMVAGLAFIWNPTAGIVSMNAAVILTNLIGFMVVSPLFIFAMIAISFIAIILLKT